jgi:hypothetical protein
MRKIFSDDRALSQKKKSLRNDLDKFAARYSARKVCVLNEQKTCRMNCQARGEKIFLFSDMKFAQGKEKRESGKRQDRVSRGINLVSHEIPYLFFTLFHFSTRAT